MLDNNDFVLNIEDISNIVTALEIYINFERTFAISESRDFDRGIQSTLSYMRDFENCLKRSEARYVDLSFRI